MDVSRPKIIYVITKANWGGAQRYVYELALAASETHDVTVMYGTRKEQYGDLVYRLKDAGIQSFSVKGLERDIKRNSDISAYRDLVRVFRENQPEIVHLNSSKAGLIGMLAARRAGVKKIIFTSHGWAFNEARPWWQKLIFKLIYACIIYGSTQTICVSKAVQRDMAWLPGSKRKFVQIYLGMNCPEQRNRLQARASLYHNPIEDEIWIGMVSELHPTKRIDDAMDAMKLIREKYPSVRLLIAGMGDDWERLIDKKSNDTDGFKLVSILRFVPDIQVHLSAFDLFLHTSESEALGYAVLEAGCAGLPVVATNVGGIPEIVTDGKTGLLVPPRRPDLVAKALTELLDNPEKASEYGAALKREVAQKFSKAKMIEQTLALY